jgi:hypothetical protein
MHLKINHLYIFITLIVIGITFNCDLYTPGFGNWGPGNVPDNPGPQGFSSYEICEIHRNNFSPNATFFQSNGYAKNSYEDDYFHYSYPITKNDLNYQIVFLQKSDLGSAYIDICINNAII